jgi:hypothetical protein
MESMFLAMNTDKKEKPFEIDRGKLEIILEKPSHTNAEK